VPDPSVIPHRFARLTWRASTARSCRYRSCWYQYQRVSTAVSLRAESCELRDPLRLDDEDCAKTGSALCTRSF